MVTNDPAVKIDVKDDVLSHRIQYDTPYLNANISEANHIDAKSSRTQR
jgi:hypothetical protein